MLTTRLIGKHEVSEEDGCLIIAESDILEAIFASNEMGVERSAFYGFRFRGRGIELAFYLREKTEAIQRYRESHARLTALPSISEKTDYRVNSAAMKRIEHEGVTFYETSRDDIQAILRESNRFGLEGWALPRLIACAIHDFKEQDCNGFYVVFRLSGERADPK